MGKNVFLMVFGGALLAIAIAIMIPGRPPEPRVNLPWQIERISDSSIRIFGLTLGQSTLYDAEQAFQEESVVTLFSKDEGVQVVEGFFKKITLSGLKAKIVVGLDYSPEELREVFDRGARIATLGSGQRKVTLSTDDIRDAMQRPIVTLTYLPSISLDDTLVQQRFGAPAQKIKEKDSDITHWLYPDKGLDIALSEEGKDVLQYTTPDRFHQLTAPLLDQE